MLAQDPYVLEGLYARVEVHPWQLRADRTKGTRQDGDTSGHEQAKAKLRCIESDEVAVPFGPPA